MALDHFGPESLEMSFGMMRIAGSMRRVAGPSGLGRVRWFAGHQSGVLWIRCLAVKLIHREFNSLSVPSLLPFEPIPGSVFTSILTRLALSGIILRQGCAVLQLDV